jgi:hypothetical protein
VLLFLLSALQLGPADTLVIRATDRAPILGTRDTASYGPPQIRISTRQGTALVWLLRWTDTVYVIASIPDTTPYWGDDFVMSVDTQGDAAPSPQHDDFQLDFRRMLDSSVVYRGRSGHWQAPQDDPYWRIGAARGGGGWEVSAIDGPGGWRLLLRLDPAWFAGTDGRLPRMALRIYDNSPSGWFVWPPAHALQPATSIEMIPALWPAIR